MTKSDTSPVTITFIPLATLDKSADNVRKTSSKEAHEQLKADIHAHGLLQNLVVVPAKGGRHHVVAGARRLAALQALQKEGKLPKDYAAPCHIADADEALELSLAENVSREAMHPADEFEAFNTLATDPDWPLSASKIAERFGVTEKHVLQRLKLARVAPQLLKEYRAGKFNLDCLMAFAISNDQKRQVQVFKSLKGYQLDNANHIRDQLTKELLAHDDKRVLFVGLDAYEKAGGKLRRDLFGEDIFLEQPEILQRLLDDKFKKIIVQLITQGWAWADPQPDSYDQQNKYGRIYGGASDKFTKAQMAEFEDDWHPQHPLSKYDDGRLTKAPRRRAGLEGQDRLTYSREGNFLLRL